MFKFYLFLFLATFQIQSQIILTHNIGDELVKTNMFSTNVTEFWGRTFTLKDFGISTSEEFIIKHGQIGIRRAYGSTAIRFDIYKIDAHFPDSFSESDLIGSSSQSAPVFAHKLKILEIEFEKPVVIDHNIERILVIAKKSLVDPPASVAVFIAGTVSDNDYSWYSRGGSYPSNLTRTIDLGNPIPDAKYYINIEGEKSAVLGVFDENIVGLDKLIVSTNQDRPILTVRTKNKKTIKSLTAYDILGRILISEKPNQSRFSVNTIAVKQGTILFLKAELDDGQVLNLKTIIL